jgi:hypothetical protein
MEGDSDEEGRAVMVAHLNLVDLAGSERANQVSNDFFSLVTDREYLSGKYNCTSDLLLAVSLVWISLL